MGPWLEQPLHQQVLPVGRELGTGPGTGLAQYSDDVPGRIDDDQFAGSVIVEEGIIVPGFEQVAGLVGGAGGRFDTGENLGSRRNGRRLGRRTARGDAAHQQMLLVRQPASRGAEQGVDGQARNFGQLPADRADPDPDAAGVFDGQGETSTIRSPAQTINFRVLRQSERSFGAILNPDQSRKSRTVRSIGSVDCGIHPHAGQLVHRRGQAGERRIGGGIHQQQVSAGG